jgi:hypothetical protein
VNVICECDECGGTGLYHGFMEAPGEYVICVRCGGTGKRELSYKPFTGRKRRNGVQKVRAGSGTILDGPGKSKWVSYTEFQKMIPENSK